MVGDVKKHAPVAIIFIYICAYMWLDIPQSTDTTLPGRRGANIFKAGQLNTALLAFRLDFIHPLEKDSTTKFHKW